MGKHVLVHKQGATLCATAANSSLLTDGQIAFYNGNTNAAVSTAVGSIPFYAAQGATSPKNPRLSPIIKAGAVKSIVKKAYNAIQYPVWNIGYQGSGVTTLNFIAASGTTTVPYSLKIQNMVTNTPPFPTAYSQYTLRAASGSTNQNPLFVADNMAKDLNQQLSVTPSIDGGTFALVNVLSDIVLATAAATGTSVTYSVANGSPTLVITDTVALTNGTALVAGCWIRIGSSATTDPVYQIASVVATSATVTTVTLTRPFVGTTNATAAISTLKVASATTVLPTSSSLVGFKVSVQGSYFTSNLYSEGKPNTNINVTASETLAGTPIIVSQALILPNGSVDGVLKDEYSALGDLGVTNRTDMPYPNDTYSTANVGTGLGYISYSIYYENPVSDKSAQGQARIESGVLNIYVVAYSDAGSTATVVTTLDAVLPSITNVALS